MDLVAGHPEGGAHRARVELPAVAVVVAHLGRLRETAARIAAAAGRRELLGAWIVLQGQVDPALFSIPGLCRRSWRLWWTSWSPL